MQKSFAHVILALASCMVCLPSQTVRGDEPGSAASGSPGRDGRIAFGRDDADMQAVVPPKEPRCYGDFDDGGWPSREELLEILEPVDDRNGKIHATHHHGRPIGRLDGLLRLRPPWSPEQMLRLSLLNVERLELFFYTGDRGVVFRLWPRLYDTWAAYEVERASHPDEPGTYRFVDADNGRYWRSGSGTFQVAWTEGKLQLTRGDLLLLEAPLPRQPGDVFINGRAMVRGLARVEAAPCAQPPPEPAAPRREIGLAELDWVNAETDDRRLASGNFRLASDADGAIVLAADREQPDRREVFTTAALPRQPLEALVLRVDKASPGTGILLADAEGRMRRRLGFFKDRRTGQLVFAPADGKRSPEEHFDFQREPIAFTSGPVWVRVATGAGILKWWIGVDGRRWSRISAGVPPVDAECTRIGLYSDVADPSHTIRLGGLFLETAQGLQSLVPPNRVKAAPVVESAGNLDDWLSQISDARPEGETSTATAWRRACLLRAIDASRPANLGQELCFALLDELIPEADAADDSPAGATEPSEDRQWPEGRTTDLESAAADFRRRIVLLRTMAQWIRFSGSREAERFSRYYLRAGERLAAAGFPRAFSAFHAGLLRTDGWITGGTELYPPELLRRELLDLAFGGAAVEAGFSARRTMYYLRLGQPDARRVNWERRQPSLEHLLHWAAARAPSPGNRVTGTSNAGRSNREADERIGLLRHPLEVTANKDAYNIYGEFRAAVAASSFAEACQILSRASFGKARGLLPAEEDPQRWVSLSLGIDQAMRKHPALRDAMQTLNPLAELRLQQAMHEGDQSAIEDVTLQFPGTPAAGEAYRWLGDRALAAGDATLALQQYQWAARSLPVVRRTALAARVRLASAMMGEDAGEPVTRPVVLGSRRIEPKEFEQMVADLLRRQRLRKRAAAENGHRPDWLDLSGEEVRLSSQSWAEIKGGNIEFPKSPEPWNVDWGARQTFLASVQGLVLLGNQLHLSAHAPDGTRIWAQRRAARGSDSPHALTAMHPVAQGQRIITRRLAGDLPELVCLDITDGRLVWTAADDGVALSDPVICGQSVITVSARRDIGDEVNASLLLVDPTTGDVRSRRHLAVFTGVRIEDLTARATLADERLLITLGGGVFCTDISGRPLWVRRQTWLSPTPEAAGPDPAWQGRVHRPPIVQGGRVLATQPGVWGIECLDVRTGRLLWQKPLPNLAAALAATEKTALVRTTGGVLALEPGDGRVAWRHDAPAAQWVMPRPVGNRLLLVRPAEVGDGGEADELPRLVALAVESGDALGSWPLAGPVANYRLIGPGMIFDGALLLAAAEEETPTARTVFRLSTDREAADEDEGALQE